MMKEEVTTKHKLFVSMFVIIGMVMAGAIPLGVLGVGSLPDYDIEQDSLGNYHKAYIDNSTGNYEIYYTNDIGGNYSQDWNPPIKITNTTTDSYLLDLGIYLITDTIYIIWNEKETSFNSTINYTFYTVSHDYGGNWTENRRSYEKIMLKYAEFDPLMEGSIPSVPYAITDTINYTYYIVQLKTPLYEEWWDGIEDSGGVICGYIPNNAYLVWMDAGIRQAVENLTYTRWIGYFHPSYKIQDVLLNETGTIEVNVKVIDEHNRSANLNSTIQEIESLGGNITYNGSSNSVIRCQIRADLIDELAYLLHVEWIDKYTDPEVSMNKIRHSDYTGADTMHNYGFDGELSDRSKIVGMVKDDGIEQDDGDGGHPDFGNLAITVGSPPDEAHGTCTFGIVFSDGSNDANAEGMLPKGKGIFCHWDETRMDSMQTLVDNGGVFQSNSWHQGAPTGEYDVNSEEDDNAVYTYDVSMLYAMGNYGQPMSSDAVAKNVISVGGIYHKDTATLADDEWNPAGAVQKGSTGPTHDMRIKPDLCGPFDKIYTTDSVDGDSNGGYATGNYYDEFGGTSGATPVVAGATGIVYQMYKENVFGNNPNKDRFPHASTVKAIQIANAYQYVIDPNPFIHQATRYQQGWGTPDLERIYDVGSDHFIVDEEVSLEKDEVATYYINAKDTLSMKISLVWTDPPQSAYNGPALINNLDLKVTDVRNNRIYWGNYGLLDSKWSSQDPSGPPGNILLADILNNVENVFIETPTNGPWKIEIFATEINQDGDIDTTEIDQHFGLVVSYAPDFYPIDLYEGWNLISLPWIQSPLTDHPDGYNYQNYESIETVLRSIGNNYDAVEYYDAFDSSDHWKIWEINKPDSWNDLKTLGHRMGFWIHVTGIEDPNYIILKVYGWEPEVDQQIDVTVGWNMVGYPSKTDSNLDYGLNNLVYGQYDDVDELEWYDALTDEWNFMDESSDQFIRSRGYWMHCPSTLDQDYWVIPLT